MADKMMRVSGRGQDGNAKAIKTDNNGVLETIGKRKGTIKTHTGLFNKTTMQIGETFATSSAVKRLDISKYNNIKIFLKNNTDERLVVWSIRLYYDDSDVGSMALSGRKEYNNGDEPWFIAPGETFVFDNRIIKGLRSDEFSSLTIETTCYGDEGTYDVGFYGSTIIRQDNTDWEPFDVRYSGEIAGTTSKVVLDTTDSIIIESIEWATNDSSQLSQCRIGLYDRIGDKTYGLYSLVQSDGTITGGDIVNVAEYGSPVWEFVTYNKQENRYKLKLKKTVSSDYGLEVYLRNYSSTPANFGIIIHGKVKDKNNLTGEIV